MKPDHPAFEHMRLVVEALAIGPGSIHARLQAAAPLFGVVQRTEMRTRLEMRLNLGIGAGLVEGGEEDESADVETEATPAEVAESIALLDESRAVEIAGDMLRLYELLAGLRTDDGYGQ